MQNSSLVLLSAGLDSTSALLMAQKTHTIKMALTFDYGQRSASQEIKHASRLCDLWAIPHQIIKIDFLNQVEHPLFSAQSTLPHLAQNELDEAKITQKSAQAVWVPNRNGVFINIAASLAEANNIKNIVVGFNIEEAQTFPDNSEPYIKAVNHSLEYSTQNSVTVISPTASLTKSQIVHYLCQNNFDFSLLWSCYKEGEKMCGECESCQRLKRALILHNQNNVIAQLFSSIRL